MMSYRNPWKNTFTIRLIAAIDMTFAFLLVSIYLQKFLLPIHYINNDVNPTQVETSRLSSIKLFLLGPIIFNSFQVVMAYNLISASRKRCEPVIAFAKANTWFQFASVMLMLLLIKLFLVLWFPPQGSLGRRDIFGVSLIVLEIVFKVFSLFIVKEFIDDLKYVLDMFPTPQYYCIYTPPAQTAASPAPTTQAGLNFSSAPPPALSSYNTQYLNNVLQTCSRAPSQNRNSAVIAVV